MHTVLAVYPAQSADVLDYLWTLLKYPNPNTVSLPKCFCWYSVGGCMGGWIKPATALILKVISLS